MVTVGFTTITALLDEVLQVYVDAPLPVKVTLLPSQEVKVLALIATEGPGTTVTSTAVKVLCPQLVLSLT